MNNDIDFKKIWNHQEIEIPEVKDLYKKALKFKRNQLYKLILVNLILLVTLVVIFFIWYYYRPQIMMTTLGITLIILAMIMYLIPLNTLFPLVRNKNKELSNSSFLKQLIKLKEKQRFQQTTMLSLYFIVLSLGIILTLVEYVSRMTITQGVFVYGLTLIWIAINWFYFRPKTIKKQQRRTNELITKFKGLKGQLIE